MLSLEPAQKHSHLVLVAPVLLEVPGKLFMFVLLLDVPEKAEGVLTRDMTEVRNRVDL